MFTGTEHQPVIRTQSFFSNVLKKTKLLSFNTSTVTFFLTVGNLLPRESRVVQLPPSPRKLKNCHISRTRQPRIPLFACNVELVSPILYTKNHAIASTGTLRIWPVFVPLWSDRGRARKKVTAVTFFHCPTVIQRRLSKRDDGIH